MAGGTVYLKTDKFEVRLEGITFKTREFETLCAMDFLFPKGKVWIRPPVVGLHVMRHPRDPTAGLLFLCFGIGCLILRFQLREELPDPILKFTQDKRISFVVFGIPEKKHLFPFDKLGLKESEVDVGYLAAKSLNDPMLKKCELANLADRVLGIKTMVGVAEAHTECLARHREIKRAICEVFVSSVIAMSLLEAKNENKVAYSAKKSLFGKNLELPSFFTEGWSRMLLPSFSTEGWSRMLLPSFSTEGWSRMFTFKVNKESHENKAKHVKAQAKEDKLELPLPDKPLKGILKSKPSGPLPWSGSLPSSFFSSATPGGQGVGNLRRSNTKGYKVTFVVNDTVTGAGMR